MKLTSNIFVFLMLCFTTCAQDHPGLILTQNGVERMKDGIHPPLFSKVLEDTKRQIDEAIREGIDVPIPKDMAGGYTHEKHKRNYRDIQNAGALYQILGDEKYAKYVKDIFMQYAAIFKTLPIHPTDRSYATGKIFWQCLNDANWMVYGSQGYDAIYNYLTPKERLHIENEFLIPYANFISIETPQFFNRIHNHSTWGNAAVGMVALAIGDDEMLNRALYGLALDEVDNLAKDNDGGFVFEEGKSKAGFFAQIDYAFSPDGYYEEGPYYQRYAMLPFMVFAHALHNKKPELKIFEYRDGILLKAVKALLNQTNQSGEFFPINDAQKGMSIHSNSVITAVNVAYGASKDDFFLMAAQGQNKVLLDQNGFDMAKKLDGRSEMAFKKSSIQLRDGTNGDAGALFIVRSGPDENQSSLVFKCTAQGLGHGHYDKLGYLYYDGDTEVMQDYGAARWVNIDQKAGGRYLKENKTWAKQSIAHNTLVLDKSSHFGGKYKKAKEHHSEPTFFNISQEKIQTVGAKDANAYPGVDLERIFIIWEDEAFEHPVVIDYFSSVSDSLHSYDMPYHFAGQIMSLNLDYKTQTPKVMGKHHGYQHLYQEASAVASDQVQMNWFKDNKFYTMTSIANEGDEILLARIGANDPEFNLRRDPLLIHRKGSAKQATYLTLIENHGTYSPVTEVPLNPYSKISSIKLLSDLDSNFSFQLNALTGEAWIFEVDKQSGETIITKK